MNAYKTLSSYLKVNLSGTNTTVLDLLHCVTNYRKETEELKTLRENTYRYID